MNLVQANLKENTPPSKDESVSSMSLGKNLIAVCEKFHIRKVKCTGLEIQHEYHYHMVWTNKKLLCELTEFWG